LGFLVTKTREYHYRTDPEEAALNWEIISADVLAGLFPSLLNTN